MAVQKVNCTKMGFCRLKHLLYQPDLVEVQLDLIVFYAYKQYIITVNKQTVQEQVLYALTDISGSKKKL
jgi:hypothetical protein